MAKWKFHIVGEDNKVYGISSTRRQAERDAVNIQANHGKKMKVFESIDEPAYTTQKDISLTGEIEKTTSSLVESTGDQFEKKTTAEEREEQYPEMHRNQTIHSDDELKRLGYKRIGKDWYSPKELALMTKQVQHVNVDSTELDTDEAARLEVRRKKRSAQAGEEYKSSQSGIDLRKIAAMERMLEKGGVGSGRKGKHWIDEGDHIHHGEGIFHVRRGQVVSQGMIDAGYDPTGDDVIQGSQEHEALKRGKWREKISGLTLEKIQTMEEILKAALPGEPKHKSIQAYKEWMRRGTGKEDWEGLIRDEERASKRRKAAEMMGLGTRQEHIQYKFVENDVEKVLSEEEKLRRHGEKYQAYLEGMGDFPPRISRHIPRDKAVALEHKLGNKHHKKWVSEMDADRRKRGMPPVGDKYTDKGVSTIGERIEKFTDDEINRVKEFSDALRREPKHRTEREKELVWEYRVRRAKNQTGEVYVPSGKTGDELFQGLKQKSVSIISGKIEKAHPVVERNRRLIAQARHYSISEEKKQEMREAGELRGPLSESEKAAARKRRMERYKKRPENYYELMDEGSIGEPAAQKGVSTIGERIGKGFDPERDIKRGSKEWKEYQDWKKQQRAEDRARKKRGEEPLGMPD